MDVCDISMLSKFAKLKLIPNKNVNYKQKSVFLNLCTPGFVQVVLSQICPHK